MKGWFCTLKSLQKPVGMEHSLVPALWETGVKEEGLRHLALTCSGKQQSLLYLKDSDMALGNFLPLKFCLYLQQDLCQLPVPTLIVFGAKAAVTNTGKSISGADSHLTYLSVDLLCMVWVNEGSNPQR